MPSPNLDGANEQDVREDVVAPFLAALGYRRGTNADILRELHLRYERAFLGRKKASDPDLAGKADYVLHVLGVGRWTLEAKAPHIALGVDEIEQAITYARHPEVSGHFACIVNGRRLLLFGASQTATEVPLMDMEVGDPLDLAERVRGTLSPGSLRRICATPAIDLGRPIAEGLGSRAKIARGELHRDHVAWHSSIAFPPAAIAQNEEMCRRLKGFVSNIATGEIYRDESLRVRARIQWTTPHVAIAAWAEKHKFSSFEYVSLSQDISRDRLNPSTLEVVGSVKSEAGEPVFDIQTWSAIETPFPVEVAFRGQATGWLEGSRFEGTYQARHDTSASLGSIIFEEFGTFWIELAE